MTCCGILRSPRSESKTEKKRSVWSTTNTVSGMKSGAGNKYFDSTTFSLQWMTQNWVNFLAISLLLQNFTSLQHENFPFFYFQNKSFFFFFFFNLLKFVLFALNTKQKTWNWKHFFPEVFFKSSETRSSVLKLGVLLKYASKVKLKSQNSLWKRDTRKSSAPLNFGVLPLTSTK